MSGQPTLSWPGKAESIAAVRPHLSTRVLETLRFGVGVGGLLVRSDAIDAAAWLMDQYRGRIDLIYVDPPFAVGADFQARPQGGEQSQFAYCDRWSSESAYLDFLYQLIRLSHELLSGNGAMYLHVDQRTSHWARCIMQEVFGREHDRGAIAWHLGNGSKSRSAWGCVHNDILCFSKGPAFKLRTDRPALREPYATTSFQTHFRHVDEGGRRYRVREINGRTYRYYADEGRLVGTVWSDCAAMNGRSPVVGESTGYPTQKPEKLIERIIEASSDPGDLVLDLCCGSGTTAAVAARLGRRWIAADVGRLAIETTLTRIASGGDIGEVRVVDIEPDAEAARGFAARIGCTSPVAAMDHEMTDHVIVGAAGERVVAVWPHGVVVTRAMLQAAFRHSNAPRAAFATEFALDAGDDDGIELWRYHPESVSAATLRHVVFSSLPRIPNRSGRGFEPEPMSLALLRIDSRGRWHIEQCSQRRALHSVIAIAPDGSAKQLGLHPGDDRPQLCGAWERLRITDAYGFTMTVPIEGEPSRADSRESDSITQSIESRTGRRSDDCTTGCSSAKR